MKKITSSQVDYPGASNQLEVPAMMTAPLETMISAHRRVFEQVEAINRLWLEAVQEANSTGADLSARLVKCDNPAEGAAVCNEWVLQRATQFASDVQEATTLWMGICGSVFAGSNEAVDPHRKDEKGGAGREKHPSSKAA